MCAELANNPQLSMQQSQTTEGGVARRDGCLDYGSDVDDAVSGQLAPVDDEMQSPPEAMKPLKFSIHNILQPQFGKFDEPPPTVRRDIDGKPLWPAWVYCTRYSDRPSAGPRSRRVKRKDDSVGSQPQEEEKRPRTAFTVEQLTRLKQQFQDNRYLTEKRRQELAHELGLNESQIKIWFQNKRAKMKKACIERPSLALRLMAQGLYNHSTILNDQ